MNDIKFDCPQCGQSLAVETAGAGTSVACPQCGQAILVPLLARRAKSSRATGWLAVLVVVALSSVVAGVLIWQRHGRPSVVSATGAPISVPDSTESPARNSEPAKLPSNTLALSSQSSGEDRGCLFPKMPTAAKAYVVNCINDSDEAKRTAFALQGLVNQSSAEVYLISSGEHEGQLKFCNKPFEIPEQLQGKDAGLRNLFQKYQTQVKKMFLYDPQKDWTWYLAQMAGAQQDGIPVTESLEHELTSEFGWKGKVEDFRNRWPNQIAAYDWALANLMPDCNKQVVFDLQMDMRLGDYVVASKGFDFWLDQDDPVQRAEMQKIFSAKGYGLGTSLMGYRGDQVNDIANPYGIGYVVSDLYGNESFWSSFPDKTYTQAPGHAVKAEPGKIYASITWSDGDNLQFDQNSLYDLWHDKDHGIIPVATYLSPTLRELNPSLLDWYYSNMTTNDELLCGPAGLQYIHIKYFNDGLFPAWCKLTSEWCRDAGFHIVGISDCPNPSAKFDTYMKTCGFNGVFGEGNYIRRGYPPKLDQFGAWDGEEMFKQMTSVKPNPQAPVFASFSATVEGFSEEGVREKIGGIWAGYALIKRQVDRVQAAYPGRYVFLLPKDQFATLRGYYQRDYDVSTN